MLVINNFDSKFDFVEDYIINGSRATVVASIPAQPTEDSIACPAAFFRYEKVNFQFFMERPKLTKFCLPEKVYLKQELERIHRWRPVLTSDRWGEVFDRIGLS